MKKIRKKISGNETRISLHSIHHFTLETSLSSRCHFTQHITSLNTSLHPTHHFTPHIISFNTSLNSTHHFTKHITSLHTSLHSTHRFNPHITSFSISLQTQYRNVLLLSKNTSISFSNMSILFYILGNMSRL